MYFNNLFLFSGASAFCSTRFIMPVLSPASFMVLSGFLFFLFHPISQAFRVRSVNMLFPWKLHLYSLFNIQQLLLVPWARKSNRFPFFAHSTGSTYSVYVSLRCLWNIKIIYVGYSRNIEPSCRYIRSY